MLTLEGLHVYYGGIHALKGISLMVEEGEIVTLIGANGAGKSTTLRAISGLVRPRSGRILFEQQPLHTLPADRIVRLGITHVPEGRRVFASLSVRENLQLGAYSRRDRGEITADLHRVYELFPRLGERQNQSAGTLSGGEQQMLAIGRALMARPRLLLLDEPSMGLAPLLVMEIFRIIKEINHGGTTILLVEQNANQALRVAHRAYVLQSGEIVREGPAAEVAQDPEVRRAYLGGDVA
ncbi:MAG: ABC transporter ATP-binding protein [Limnochordaceae bacterium]|nr:ABC transporter ATP-binding protein [Limnochordaceae bacterium]